MEHGSGTYTQACAVLYDGPPLIDAQAIGAALRAAGARHISVVFEAENHTGPDSIVRGRIRMDGHTVHVVSAARPATDQTMRVALREALLDDEDRESLLAHQGCTQCLYLEGSTSPLAQLRALYRVAGALITASGSSSHALGVVDAPALIALPAAEAVSLLRWLDASPPPIGLWVRLFCITDSDGDLWLLTRGLTHFQVPELALRARDVSGEDDGESLLMSIASWIITGAGKIRPGDKLTMMAEENHPDSSATWRCVVPEQKAGWMAAPFGTVLLLPA